MRVYHFSEEPYPDAWSPELTSLRVVLRKRMCEPERARELYHRFLDEWQLADELGLDIMVNEHHATATCMTSASTVILGILARITKRARLLILGVPIAHRADPVRIAEEMAMVDVISGGRLELGFIKGVPYEIAPANSSPLDMMDRFWEAHDLIVQAFTTHDGPFNFEGRFFQHRNVNIWPRPMQQPHPPIWGSTANAANAKGLAKRGYVMATFMGGQVETLKLHKAYAEGWREAGRSGDVPVDRFGYLAMAAVASCEDEAIKRANVIANYLRTNAQIAEPFNKPPGYFPVEATVRSLRSANPKAFRPLFTPAGRQIDLATATLDDFIECGIVFCGTPDNMYQQISSFVDGVGGLGHMLLMLQGGHLSAADTRDSMTLFAKEVYPRLKERFPEQRLFDAA